MVDNATIALEFISWWRATENPYRRKMWPEIGELFYINEGQSCDKQHVFGGNPPPLLKVRRHSSTVKLSSTEATYTLAKTCWTWKRPPS